jgi:hypothetical protein
VTATLADRDRAVAAVVTGGASFRQAADMVGVTAPTVKRWVDQAKAEVPAAAPPQPIPPPGTPPAGAAEPDPLPDDGDPVKTIRATMARMHAMAVKLETAGNFAGAAQAHKKIADMVPSLLRAEKAARVDGDGIHVTREAIAEARDAVREKVKAMAAQPRVCAECRRKIVADLSGYDIDAIEKAARNTDTDRG